MLININSQNPQQRLIDQAVEILQNDGVIIYPTDTVYGLGCSIYSKKAVDRIARIKNMDPKKPMTLICSSESQLQSYTQGISTPIFKILRRQLPGPYTFIFNASKELPKMLSTKRKTVGVRWPNHNIATSLVDTLQAPILSISLRNNEDELYDDPTLLHEEYGKQVDLVIDGGTIFSAHSTIIDCTGDQPELIRRGKGDHEWLDDLFD